MGLPKSILTFPSDESVEVNPQLWAKEYARPLRYIYDKSLKGETGAFRYVFEEGSLRCSKTAEIGNRVCLVSKGEITAIARESPSFVYADNGCWADDPEGTGLPIRRRDFVLVCGPNVYLCELIMGTEAPKSNVSSVQRLFTELAQRGCGVNVLGYSRARDMFNTSSINDPNLFLFLGDLHLPPVSWFYTEEEMKAIKTKVNPPEWLGSLPPMRRNKPMYDYYSLVKTSWDKGEVRRAHSPGGDPDIFRSAGDDLVGFLRALSELSPATKQILHFIQTGDMFELWLNRPYQYQPGYFDPSWLDMESPNRVSSWALEVMIQNIYVIEAFRQLERAGLAEVSYVWGNHDAYLKEAEVTSQLDLPPRKPFLTLMGDVVY
jgi:hypothetical protein